MWFILIGFLYGSGVLFSQAYKQPNYKNCGVNLYITYIGMKINMYKASIFMNMRDV